MISVIDLQVQEAIHIIDRCLNRLSYSWRQNDRPPQIDTCMGRTLKRSWESRVTSIRRLKLHTLWELSAAAITSLRNFESPPCVCVDLGWPIVLPSAVITVPPLLFSGLAWIVLAVGGPHPHTFCTRAKADHRNFPCHSCVEPQRSK